MTGEQEILQAYQDNPNAVYSINELSKRIGKTYPYVHKKVHALVTEGVLKRTPVGRSHLCSINLTNKRSVMLLALNETKKHATLPNHIKETHKTLKEQAKNNTITVAVYDPEQDEILIATEETTTLPHIRTVNIETIKQRLLQKETFYKEHVVLEGYEEFFSIIAQTDIARRYHPLL